ncbi:MAG: hypothetical protein ABI635_10625 [Actinomycetota bacterium]
MDLHAVVSLQLREPAYGASVDGQKRQRDVVEDTVNIAAEFEEGKLGPVRCPAQAIGVAAHEPSSLISSRSVPSDAIDQIGHPTAKAIIYGLVGLSGLYLAVRASAIPRAPERNRVLT